MGVCTWCGAAVMGFGLAAGIIRVPAPAGAERTLEAADKGGGLGADVVHAPAVVAAVPAHREAINAGIRHGTANRFLKEGIFDADGDCVIGAGKAGVIGLGLSPGGLGICRDRIGGLERKAAVCAAALQDRKSTRLNSSH